MTKHEAVAHFGSISALAAALNITTQAISQWGDQVPQLRTYQIRELVSGRQHKEQGPRRDG